MTSPSLPAQMIKLGSVFRVEVDDMLQATYADALGDIPLDALARAVSHVVDNCRYMPCPAELRQFSGAGNKAQALVAWQAVTAAIGAHGRRRSVDFGPIVNAAVRDVGGWMQLCLQNEKDYSVWTKKAFVEAFERHSFGEVPTAQGSYLVGAEECAGHNFGRPPRPAAQIGAAPSARLLASAQGGLG